jgi:uncharacterized SAM-binding protein YcdF (DUF218 family)
MIEGLIGFLIYSFFVTSIVLFNYPKGTFKLKEIVYFYLCAPFILIIGMLSLVLKLLDNKK